MCKLHTDRAIKAALESLPSDMNQTYMRILEQIYLRHGESLPQINRLFRWIIGSKRPLSLQELAEAVAIESEDTEFDPDGVATDPEDLVALCGSLVVVDRSTEVPYVRFAHYSVEEFLRSDLLTKTSVSTFYVDIEAVNLELSMACVQYLCFLDFENPCESTRKLIQRLNDYKLLDYVVHGWYEHLRDPTISDINFDTYLKPKLQYFLHPSNTHKQFGSWVQAYSYPGIFIKEQPSLWSDYAFFYAENLGLSRIVQMLLPTISDVNDILCNGMNALQIAAGNGDTDIVQLLLGAQADINLQGDRLLTPLHTAAEYGKHDVVKILIDKGALIHRESGSGSTAFYRAMRSGSLPTIRLLYEAGSDINAKTWDDWTPLHEAVENSDVAAVKALLEWGADMNVGGERAPNPLEVARLIRNNEIVRLLEPLTDPEIAKHSIAPNLIYGAYLRLKSDHRQSEPTSTTH